MGHLLRSCSRGPWRSRGLERRPMLTVTPGKVTHGTCLLPLLPDKGGTLSPFSPRWPWVLGLQGQPEPLPGLLCTQAKPHSDSCAQRAAPPVHGPLLPLCCHPQHACTHVRTHTCTHTQRNAHAHTNTHARMCTHTYMHTVTYTCMYVNTEIHAHMHRNTPAYTYAHACTHIITCMHVHPETHACAYTCACTLMHTEKHTCMHMHKHTCIHACTCMHTHTCFTSELLHLVFLCPGEGKASVQRPQHCRHEARMAFTRSHVG